MQAMIISILHLNMNSYYDFMEHIQEGTITTGLVESIEKILLDMIMKRSVTKEFTKEVEERTK